MSRLRRSMAMALPALVLVAACYQDRSPRPTGNWARYAAGETEFGTFEVWRASSTQPGHMCLSVEMTPDAFADDGVVESDSERYQGHAFSCVEASHEQPLLLFVTTGGRYGAVALLLPPGDSAAVRLGDGTTVESAIDHTDENPNLFLGFYADASLPLTSVSLRSEAGTVNCAVRYREPLGPVGALSCGQS